MMNLKNRVNLFETSLPPLNEDWNENERKTSHHKEKQNTSQSNVKQRLLMNIKISLSQIKQHQEMIIMKNLSKNLNKM